ncbi:NAD(P)H-binding protein [Flavobacterium sp. ANB]|uniref:NmrA family NAD(P)-binding protein n=1 Tax=unclassified Flavobacterium TaxID=196869 RepID=UPI0012B87D33|nr:MULTISPECIES: NAD(P)H-binding protein [unclassified Flavobacterium]MBF4515865.1 NAD(P)H-binding protein [Flavobacterium sp. ANB]MTD68867.1 NAD(P)H-binding protein [Flavobacterium sp. LC2016-13]
MILVTTPTGNTGSMILQQLVEQGQQVRIFVRDPEKIPADILEKVEVATGSLLNEYEFTKALQGCDTLYFCVPQTNTQEDVNAYYEGFAKVASNAIKNAGTKRVVYLSSGGKESNLQAGIITALHIGEDIINQSGASVRALRCPVFFESLLYQIASLKKMGMFFLPIDGNYKIPQVAVKDIATKAVEFLIDKTWTGVEGFAVHGPANISYNDIALQMSELTGKHIRFEQVSKKDYVKSLLDHHSTTEAFANSLTDMLTVIGNGLYDTEPRTEATTTPTTIKEWMSENLVSKMN